MTSLPPFIATFLGPEMIWVVVILLLLFGAKKLPQLARGIGESIGEFKKARKDFEDDISSGEEQVLLEDDKDTEK